MSYQTICYEVIDHIARVVLNCPDRGNMVDLLMGAEIAELCREINQDDSIYTVVITGAGDAFCLGAAEDLTLATHPAASVATIEVPVIAAINGDAIAEGLEIALSCDIRLAASGARFSLPQLARGRLPAGGGTQRLSRLIGIGTALEMLLTGMTVSAVRAQEIGLVSQVYPSAALEEETEKIARMVAAKGPLASRYLKEAVIKGMDMTLEQGLRLEADLYFLLHTTADRTEGITAFREKRSPDFKAR